MNQPNSINKQKIKEKSFDLLYQFAQRNMEGGFDFIFKQGSFLAIATGLILGATKDSIFFSSILLKIGVCFFFVLLTILHYFWLDSYRNRSDTAIQQLRQLDYLPPVCYENLSVGRRGVISVQLYHSILVLLLCLVILTSS